MNATKLEMTVVAITALLALAPVVVAQKGPAPVDLGTLGGTYSAASGVNSKDVAVGASTLEGDTYTHAFVRLAGTLTDLGTLIGPTGNSAAVAINSGIAGTSDFNITDPNSGIVYTVTHSFYYTSPSTGMVDIGTVGGDTTYATYVRSGNVVGSSLTADDTATHAFLWQASTGMMKDLNTLPGGTTSKANGVNQNGGKVVGSSDVPDGSVHATMWVTASNQILDMGTIGGSFAEANAINAYGLVVGDGTTVGDATTDAFVGVYGALIDIGNLGGSYATASAATDSGVVVGFSNTTNDADVHAFVWTARGGMVDLNSLLPVNSPWDLQAAASIAPDGTIVGVGIINGEYHAFSW